jgi:hypothetical protein
MIDFQLHTDLATSRSQRDYLHDLIVKMFSAEAEYDDAYEKLRDIATEIKNNSPETEA